MCVEYSTSRSLAGPIFLLINLHNMIVNGGIVNITPKMTTTALTENRDIGVRVTAVVKIILESSIGVVGCEG